MLILARNGFQRLEIEWHLRPGAPRLQHIEAEPGDDGREPAAQVRDPCRVGAAHPQPGVLDGVFGFGS